MAARGISTLNPTRYCRSFCSPVGSALHSEPTEVWPLFLFARGISSALSTHRGMAALFVCLCNQLCTLNPPRCCRSFCLPVGSALHSEPTEVLSLFLFARGISSALRTHRGLAARGISNLNPPRYGRSFCLPVGSALHSELTELWQPVGSAL